MAGLLYAECKIASAGNLSTLDDALVFSLTRGTLISGRDCRTRLHVG